MCTPSAPAPNFHRLNAKQYEQTVNQLLSTQLQLRPDLPVDSNLYGFDNNADTLFVPPILMEKYLEAAGDIVDQARPERIFIAQPGLLTSRRATAKKMVTSNGRSRTAKNRTCRKT